MEMIDNITLCLTIGKRPNELRKTLESLFKFASFKYVIAINDFGDDETNQVFKELCPNGELICLGYNLGHHKAIDYMYAKIETLYVFHCEDDWEFLQKPNFKKIIKLLDENAQITSVSLRAIDDFGFNEGDKSKIKSQIMSDMGVLSLNDLHEQWYGYHFNPHIAKMQTYQSLAPFSQFKKERHISRRFRKQGKYTVFLAENICRHIGWENSVANPPKKNWFEKIKAKIFG